MSDARFILPGPEIVTLAGASIDKLVRAGDGDAALLYLYILRTQGKNTVAEAEAALGSSPGGIAAAATVLSRLGLAMIELDQGAYQGDACGDTAGVDSAPVGAVPAGVASTDASIEDMRRELETGAVFSTLVEEAQRSLGKVMSPDELMRLFGIYDNLRLAPEVILQLITHCISESRGRSGGRMPSMRSIEKTAYAWEREEIFSLDRAEEYIKALEARKSARGEIKRALQIWDREFSETEKRYVDKWIGMGFPAEVVAVAYDRTVVKTGKLSWNYMDKIVSNWDSRGLRTPQDIAEKDRSPGMDGALQPRSGPEQKFGSAKREDVERMKRLLEKTKKDD